MHLIYLDESGNSGTNLSDPQQPIFILGALPIPEEKWKALVEKTEILKASFSKKLGRPFEIHAHEISSGRGDFRSIGLKDRLEFIHSALDLIIEFEIPFLYRAINKKPYAKWLIEHHGAGTHINPHLAAFPFLAKSLNTYLEQIDDTALGTLICDDNREVHLDIEASLSLLQKEIGDMGLNRLIEKGFFIDSRKSLPLQLADLCVYYARKEHERTLGMKPRSIDDEAIKRIEILSAQRFSNDEQVFAWLKKQPPQKKGAARDPNGIQVGKKDRPSSR